MSIIQNLTHPFINAVGWTLIHSLWQFTLITILWVIALRFTKQTSPSLRYNISLTALILMPVTFTLTFLKQYIVYINASKITGLSFESSEWMVSQHGTEYFLIDKNNLFFPNELEMLLPHLFWVYITGAFLFATYTFFNYSKYASLQRNPASTLTKQQLAGFRQMSLEAGLKKEVQVIPTNRISIPFVTGFLKPVILIPISMLTLLSPEQVEIILLHEYYHIKRKDHYINFIQNIFEILFFYHPGVWIINKFIRKERENCVDAWIVKQTGKPKIYAGALIQLEENRNTSTSTAVAATQSKNHLLKRIKNIMTMKTPNHTSGQKIAALLIIFASVISLAWLNPAISINRYADETIPNSRLTEEQIQNADDTAQTNVIRQNPVSIQLEEGKTVKWDSLSESDRAEIKKAISEARIALSEVRSEFDSVAFREEMKQAREEIKAAMKEVKVELQYLKSEEFAKEMAEARKEIKVALEEINKELIEPLNSEEFRSEMKEVSAEVLKIIEETAVELEEIGPMVTEILNAIFSGLAIQDSIQ
jgi:bla regulator protein blaR1